MSDDLTLAISTCTRDFGAKTGQPTYKTSNPRTITGWKSVRVSRGIERCPSDFEVSFTEPYPDVTKIIAQPGDYCEVRLGPDLVLTGFVDRYLPSYNRGSHEIRIAGRSKCQDIVDCAAKWMGGQMLNTPLLKIAQNMCDVYGVPVRLANGADQGEPIPQLNLMLGESPYDVLERLCRFRALLLYDEPDGSLLLSGIGNYQAASGFKEGVNVLSATAMFGMDGRFSDYDAVRQSLDTLKDIGEGENLIVSVTDESVPRLRYRIIVAESVNGGPDVAIQRAQWEKNRRAGRSFQVKLTTDTWRDSSGVLWEPNTLVALDLPSLKIAPTSQLPLWTIAAVTYKRDKDGTTADLVLMPPQAFRPEPIILNPIVPDISQASR